MSFDINTAVADPDQDDDALDARIACLSEELAQLHRRRRDRNHSTILLAILEVIDGWFMAHELHALVPLSPTLSVHLAGASAKSIGRRLKTIADVQQRSDTVPTLRLLRCKTTSAATVWKIET